MTRPLKTRKTSRDPSFAEHPTAALARLAWPICVSLLSYSAMTLVDTLFVGQLGTAALAGVGIAGVAAFAILCFPMGVLRGVKVLVSQAAGAGRQGRAGPILAAGLVLATVLGALAVLATVLTAEALPALLEGEGGLLARDYLWVRALGAPLFLWGCAIKETRYGLRDSRSPMVASVAANVANIALDALFIFGLELGVTGAALASVLAQGVEALWLVLVQRKEGLALRAARWSEAFAVLRLGVPTGLQMLVEVSAFSVMTALLARRSELDVAAHQIALQVVHFAFLPSVAVGEAAGVLAGEAIGAGRPRWVLPIARRALVAVLLYGALCSAIFAGFASTIASGFSDDEALVSAAAALLTLAALFILVDGAQIIARGVLRGTGDVRTPALLSVAGAWLITPPMTWWLGLEKGWGALGAWTGLSVEIFVIAALLWWRAERFSWLSAARGARRTSLRS